MNPDWSKAFVLRAGWLFFAFVFSQALPSSGAPVDGKFSSRLWQMESGLPHNIVQAITQSVDGNLWVGTREGLARFDGMHFTAIDFPGPITHPSISALHAGGDGTLWIGTENAGFFCLSHGKLLRRSLWNGSSECVALDIKSGSEGAVWVGTDGGLARIKQDDIEFQKGIKLAISF
jgi:ligand-binding sensor domain-containing protein